MKLSIIVPVYNMTGDGKLQYCLNSLVGQSIEDYEIIAVDDASTDDSLAVLREYEMKYPEKVRVLTHEMNKRQGAAKNTGLQVARGEWIGFIDSDDWVTPDYYEKLLNKAEETGADIVGCDYLLTDELGKQEGPSVVNNTEDQTGVLDDEKHRKLIIRPGSMVIKIYKRELFLDTGLRFPEKIFYEDNAIGVIPLLYAKRFERVPECMYFYYQYNTSTVHTISLERCRDRVKASQIYIKECKSRGFYEKFKQEIDYKVFELGYRNTLFSHLQSVKKADYKFVTEMLWFLEENIPDIEENPYYEQYMDAENKKFLRMHRKNTRWFLVYYRLLHVYRRLRYGKG